MDRFADIISLAGSFLLIILVLILTYFVTRWYASRMGPATGGKYVKIVDRSTVANGSALVIAKVSGKYYLLGVSDKEINLLCELPDFKEDPQSPAAPAQFQKLFRDFLDKSGPRAANGTGRGDGEEQ